MSLLLVLAGATIPIQVTLAGDLTTQIRLQAVISIRAGIGLLKRYLLEQSLVDGYRLEDDTGVLLLEESGLPPDLITQILMSGTIPISLQVAGDLTTAAGVGASRYIMNYRRRR